MKRATTGGHPTRQAMLALLELEPGLSERSIRGRLDLSSGTGRHHLGVLRREGAVWSLRLGGRDWYFPGAKPFTEQERLEAVAGAVDPSLRAILDVVGDGLRQKEVLAALPWCHSTTQNRLARLVRIGLLVVERNGPCVVYRKAVA